MKRIYHTLRRLCLVLVLLLSTSAVMAQGFWFKSVGITHGLSSSQVNCVFKDSKGFIWLGTSSGLDRYDGAQIVSFQTRSNSSNSLPDSYIASIQEAPDGNLWIQTNGGYVVMDPVKMSFDRSVSQRLSMLTANLDPEIVFYDSRKNLWVYEKGQGIFYYKYKQQLVYTLRFDDARASLRAGNISDLCNGPEGVMAVYTNGLVACLSGEGQKAMWYNDVIAKNTKQEDDYKIFCDTKGNLYVYSEAYTYIYDKAKATWYRSLQELAQQWGAEIALGNSLVTGVSQDARGNVWISTDRNGLLCLNIGNNTITAHVMAGGLRGLQSNNLQTVYIDDTDLLWVGTQRMGVNYYAPNLYMFDVDNVGDIYGMSEARDGGLWLATHDAGLLHKDLTTGEVYALTTTNGLSDNLLSCVLEASDGTVWAGSNRFGLNRINGGVVTQWRAVADGTTGILDNNVQALAEDRYNNIWIGTKKGGLQCYNTKTGKFTTFSTQNGKLNSDNVTSISTSGSQLAAGTTNGVLLLNISSNKSSIYTGTSSGDKHFTSNVVTQVFIDSRGLVWIGTRDGLNILDPSMDQLTTYDMSIGLPSNVICGIAEDKNHDVWITTSKGVSRVAVQNGANESSRYAFNFYRYTYDDGLQAIEFNMGAILANAKGDIYMGGPNGYNWIRPLPNNPRKRPLAVFLSRLTIDGQPIMVGERYGNRLILPNSINGSKSITLRNTDKDICISLGVDDYNHAEHPRFIYQLEGESDAWRPVTGDGRTLMIEGLSSGRYTLHVKAMLDDGKTVSEEHVLIIHVEKPWYLQWWVFVLAGLLVLGVAYLIYRIYPYIMAYYRERKQEVVALKKRKEEIEQVAQEIRTNVVAMIPQLGLLQMEAPNAQTKEVLNGLHHSARQMLSSLNSLKENTTVMVSDAGLDTTGGLLIGDDDILIGDDGPVEAGAGDGEFLVSDDGIISASGVPVMSSTLKHLIYIVEPDADMLEFVADSLKNTYQLRTFTSVKACWEAMIETRPSLVMCAEDMPEVTGSQLCDRIKNERAMERIPFILTTSGTLTQSELVVKRISLMADDYIPSPYNLQSVIIRVNKLLGEPTDANAVMDDTLRGAEVMSQAAAEQLRSMLEQYVMQNISRKELSIEEMSRVLNMSRTMLFRKLEHVTGMSPADFIRKVRLTEAAKLLNSGYVSPAEVAQELGFGNLATFSRFFQAEYGMLPSEYLDKRHFNQSRN